MLRKTYIIIAFCLCCIGIRAEQTTGNCTIKDAPGGNAVFELKPAVIFESKPERQGWQRVLLKVWIPKRWVYDEEQIRVKAKLYDENRMLLGIALKDFTPYKSVGIEDSMYVFQLSGFIEQNCIAPASVAEDDLNALLKGLGQNARLDTFKTHLSKYPYQSWVAQRKYQSFVLTEPDFIQQRHTPRILMVFYENELIAIFYSRSVSARFYDSIEMGSQYKLIYNSKFTEKTKTEMLELFRAKVEAF